MHFLPFEIYLSPLDINKYGPVWEIPNYLTEEEFQKQTQDVIDFGDIPSDLYPNVTIPIPPSNKSALLYEHYRNGNIPNYLQELFPAAKYTCLFTTIGQKEGVDPFALNIYDHTCVNEKVQGNPKGMEPYPPHPDGGKLMTVLNPLSPVESVPTTFNGLHGSEEPVDLGWEVNKAYMFIPSFDYSYHSYTGDPDSDRWVTMMNIFGIDTKQP